MDDDMLGFILFMEEQERAELGEYQVILEEDLEADGGSLGEK